MKAYIALLASLSLCLLSQQELRAGDQPPQAAANATVAFADALEQAIAEREITAASQPCWRCCLGRCWQRCMGRWTKAKPAAGRATETMLKIGEALIARRIIEQLIGELGSLVPGVLTAIASIIHLPAPTPEQLQMCTTAFVECISKGLRETLTQQNLITQPAAAAQALAPDLIEVLKAVIVPDEATEGRRRLRSGKSQPVSFRVKRLSEIEAEATVVTAIEQADRKTR